jgi:cell division protein FtsZ
MAEILPEIETFARIKVVGVGGGGINALNRMVQSKLRGIDFVAVNTDAQALHYSQANKKVHIGKDTTRGLGAGANPDIGRQAAEESQDEIYEALKNSEMVFITCGLGGGTGTGAAPVIAKIARDIGALTVAIVTKPFNFEGERRRQAAESGIAELKDKVDTLIVIPNDRILQIIDRKTSLLDAFGVVDDVLRQGVQGIADLITVNGLVNLDFADVKSIMSNAGSALMGIGQGNGDMRAIDAVKQAIDSPLLEISVEGAKGVLINFTGGRDMGMHEIEEAAKLIHDSVDPEANIIWGMVLDENLTGEIRVTLVATGFDDGTPNSEKPSDELSRKDLRSVTVGDMVDASEKQPSPEPEPSVEVAEKAESEHKSFIPFLSRSQDRPVYETDQSEPLISSEPPVAEPAEPELEVATETIETETETPEREEVEFSLDESVFDNESQPAPRPVEPMVERATEAPAPEQSKDDYDKPAFLRRGLKLGRGKKTNDDDDIPAFIRKKL